MKTLKAVKIFNKNGEKWEERSKKRSLFRRTPFNTKDFKLSENIHVAGNKQYGNNNRHYETEIPDKAA